MFSLKKKTGFSLSLFRRYVHKQLSATEISRNYGRFTFKVKFSDAVTYSGREHYYLKC